MRRSCSYIFNNKIIKKEESVIDTDCNTHHDAFMFFITLNRLEQLLLLVKYRVIQYMLLKACEGVNAKLKHAFNSLYYVYKWSTK